MKGAFVTGWVVDIFQIFLYATLISVLFLVFGVSFTEITDIIGSLLTSLWEWFF